MKTEKEFFEFFKSLNSEIILHNTLGCQLLISYDEKKQSLYFLNWSPRENSGEPREYINFEKAIDYINQYKPELLDV